MNSSENATLHRMKTLSPGSAIEAVDCDGRVWDAVFWELDGDTAYVSSPERYQRMINGDAEARPIGFLVSDLVIT